MDNPPSFDYQGGLPVQPTPVLKHSGLGVASFIISILSGLGMLGFFIFVFVVTIQKTREAGAPVSQADLAHAPEMAMAGLFGLGMLVGEGIAFILGVISLFISGFKKTFGILGVVFSLVPILIFLFFFIIGLINRHG